MLISKLIQYEGHSFIGSGHTKIEHINIYGDQGVGKTRLIVEVVRYLRYRFCYTSGIFYVDMKENTNFEQINQLIDSLNKDFYRESEPGTPKTPKSASSFGSTVANKR